MTLKEREVKINVYRKDSASSLFNGCATGTGGKIRKPKTVQQRGPLCTTRKNSIGSINSRSVVVVPIKIEWKPDNGQEVVQTKVIKPQQQQQPMTSTASLKRQYEKPWQLQHQNSNSRAASNTRSSINCQSRHHIEAVANLSLENSNWKQGYNCLSGGRPDSLLRSTSVQPVLASKPVAIRCQELTRSASVNKRVAIKSEVEADSSGVGGEIAPADLLSLFRTQAVTLHNVFRKKHGVPDLELDADLCNFAQKWAERLAWTKTFDHRPDNDFGENLYSQYATSSNADCSAETVVESWYRECKGYNFRCEPVSLGFGHFTQLVWKNTRRMGIGKAKAKDGKRMVIVANYDPPGNFVGQYVQNIPAPSSSCAF